MTIARAFEDTTTDLDIDEQRHLLDYPVRLADYRGSLYWSGNEGDDLDTRRPKGGTYLGDTRNGTLSQKLKNAKRAVHCVYGSTVVIVIVIFYSLISLLMDCMNVTAFKQVQTVSREWSTVIIVIVIFIR